MADLFAVDGARLTCQDRTLFGWLRVDRLDLEIPGKILVGAGATRYQRRRCRLEDAEISVDEGALEAVLAHGAAALGRVGLDDVQARVLEDVVEISGRVRAGDRLAQLTARCVVTAGEGRRVRLTLGQVHVFGFLGRPTPLVAHDLLRALVAGAVDGVGPAVRGLADLEIPVLDEVLFHLMPAEGWRLPDVTEAALSDVAVDRGRVVLRYGGEVASRRRLREAGLLAALSALADGDARLLEGDAEGAASAYRAALARGGPEAPYALERLLGVLVGRESTLREADSAAREALVRWPGLVPAHLALAAVGVERGRNLEAAEHFGRVVEISEEAGDDEDVVRAALAAARLLRPSDAAGAARHYARVLERRAAHAEAAEALVERYAAEERWSDLLKLARRRIAATTDPGQQAREHVRIGEIYLVRLGDAARAREELLRATELAEGDPRAWDALGRALSSLGDHAGAVTALDRQVALQAAKGDAVGEARTHARVASLFEIGGDDTAAGQRYRRALELTPEDDDLLERLARVDARRGELGQAIAGLTRLLALAVTDGARRRRASRELARVLAQSGDADGARQHLEGAAGGDAAEEADRLEILADLEEKAGRGAEAAGALARAATLDLPAARAAALELRRARLCDALGRVAEADAARERAFAASPDTAAGEAPRALAASARARGDAQAEARWLDVLLRVGVTPSGPAFADIAVRRAELAQRAGQAQQALAHLDAAGAGGQTRAARRLRAEALASLGRADASARVLEGLAAEAETDAEAAELLARGAVVLMAAPDPTGALKLARAAVKRDDKAEGARRTAGEAAWQLRAWEDVIAAYEPLGAGGRALTVEIGRRLGMALERVGREVDALPAYRAAVSDPKARGEALAIAWRRLGELQERQGAYAEAAETLAVSATDERTGESPSARAGELHRAAEILRKRLGATDHAVHRLEAALRLCPDHLPSLDALESIADESGDPTRVAAILGRKIAATARQPERQKALLLRLAEVQERVLGRVDVALEAHRRALAMDPDLVPALCRLAEAARDAGDLKGARELWLRATAAPRDPLDGETVLLLAAAHTALAEIARAEGRDDDAATHLAESRALEMPARPESDTVATGDAVIEDTDAVEAHLDAARTHEARGETDAALVHYEEASAADPFDMRPLDALTAIGEARGDHELIAELLGRRILVCTNADDRARLWLQRALLYRDRLAREPEAVRCLKEAFANDPHNLEITRALRQLCFARGEHVLAGELYYREIEGTADPVARAALHRELADLFEAKLGDIDGAVRNLESALALDPACPGAAAALARLYSDGGRVDEAARAEEAAAASAGGGEERAERLLHAAGLQASIGRRSEALRLLEAAAETPGGGSAAIQAREEAQRLLSSAQPDADLRVELTHRYERAEHPVEKLALLRELLHLARLSGDHNEADLRAREILARDPTDGAAFAARRDALSARGDHVTLAELTRTRADALHDAAERADGYFEVGRIYLQKLGDQGRAAMAFEQALSLDPGHAAALDSLADLAYRQHDWDRAHAYYRRLDPESSFLGHDVVYYRRGELAEMLGLEDEAEAAYNLAVGQNPSHLSALEALARLALYKGEVTSAISALRAVLELLPLDDVERITTSRQQLGELCQRAGDAASARAYFELVLVEDPTRVAVLGPLADLYAGAGMWPRAVETLDRLSCLVTTPERRADILYRTGEILRLQLGDEERASDAYLKAIDLDPQHVPTMRRLVDYYWTLSDDASLSEMAADLDARGELLASDTSHETLAKVAISAALDGDDRFGLALARVLGDGGAGAVATVLCDAGARRPDSDGEIVRVAHTLCKPPGPPLDIVRQVVAARAEKDETAARLAGKL